MTSSIQQPLQRGNFVFLSLFYVFLFVLGVDPKSVLCSFYKQGQCQKGNKCKFSHDLSIERKAEKRSIYDDARDNKGSFKYYTLSLLAI